LPMLHGWSNFFIMAGTAGATLIGLLFVALTVGTGFSTVRGLHSTRAFLTPTLVHFGTVLFQCLAVLAPWPSMWPIGILLGLDGLAGLAYQIHVILMQRKVAFASPDRVDWVLFSIAPALGYTSLTVGGVGLIAEKSFAPYAIAGAIMLLLFAGVHGAWDLTVRIARNRDKT